MELTSHLPSGLFKCKYHPLPASALLLLLILLHVTPQPHQTGHPVRRRRRSGSEGAKGHQAPAHVDTVRRYEDGFQIHCAQPRCHGQRVDCAHHLLPHLRHPRHSALHGLAGRVSASQGQRGGEDDYLQVLW